ncbi:MAG: hypothetical protein ACI38A_12200 [Candidatus Ornithomonoglobus sp.]
MIIRNKKLADMIFITAMTKMDKKDYSGALNDFKRITELDDNADAMYNIGTMYATGRGTEQNFLEAAKWFKRAADKGIEGASQLLTKTRLDYINSNIDNLNEKGLYNAVTEFVSEALKQNDIFGTANAYLCEYGNFMLKKGEHEKALKAYRTGAIYGRSADCCYNTAVEYYQGYLVKSIPAALYWFDKAARYGDAEASKTRDNIINSYNDQNGDKSTKEMLGSIAMMCVAGNNEIPSDSERASYWLAMSN